MAYPTLGTINATTDPTVVLIYANDLTGGVLMPMVLGAFFVIVLLASFFAQLRLTGRGRPEVSFATAGFTTFGFAMMMSIRDGLLNPIYTLMSLAVAIIGFAWLVLSQE